MTPKAFALLLVALASLLGTFVSACSPGPSEKTGSQTNWLKLCSDNAECGELQCLCGVCSNACDAERECSGLAGASCIAASDPGAIAVCAGEEPATGMCLPSCSEDSCTTGQCVAGVCAPQNEADLHLSIDTEVQHQTLLGFGGSLNFAEEVLVAHSQRQALYRALFADAGLDVVRLRNRFDDNPDALGAASEILSAAAESLGRPPTILLTEASPPAALKANAQRSCGDEPDTCTLAQTAEGDFVYAAFAEHWKASLDAYADAGIVPDYLSIQNNADWSPPAAEAKEACRFLPEEGSTNVTFDDGSITNAAFPGYREALDGVRAALTAQYPTLGFMVPEVGSVERVSEYVTRLEQGTYDAVAFHLYTTEPADIDIEGFHELRELGRTTERPLLQTEMRADGLGTAVLLHYSLVEADAAAYLQNDLVVSPPADGAESSALVLLSDAGVEAQDQYHALRHFSRHTDPGWTRVDAVFEASALLASAWLSPNADALSVVLVNPGHSKLSVALDLVAEQSDTLKRTQVTRTVFDGLERSAELGPLGSDRVVTLPPRSMLSVAYRQ